MLGRVRFHLVDVSALLCFLFQLSPIQSVLRDRNLATVSPLSCPQIPPSISFIYRLVLGHLTSGFSILEAIYGRQEEVSSSYVGILSICTFSIHVERVLWDAGNMVCTARGHGFTFHPPKGSVEVFFLILKKLLALVRLEPFNHILKVLLYTIYCPNKTGFTP